MAENPHRVMTLRELIGEYFGLPKGELIDKPAELLRVADIKDGKHADHPHKGKRVYISRRAFKHFIEERKDQLSINHAPVEVLGKITFVAEQISEVVINFDKYEYEAEPPKYFYTKHYVGEPSIRILCEIIDADRLEICSIHFKKKQKTPS